MADFATERNNEMKNIALFTRLVAVKPENQAQDYQDKQLLSSQ